MSNDFIAGSRNSEAAQILENFLDRYSKVDFAEGFDYLMSQLEDVASDIDAIVTDLEQLCSSYESDIDDYQREIADLNEQLEEQQ